MYARVAVASTALDMGPIQPHIANSLHGALVEALLAHGRLVFASNDEALTFVRALKGTVEIPQAARTRWEAMLIHLKQSGRVVIAQPPSETTLASVEAIDVLRAGWGGHTDVAVVAPARSAALGLPEDTGILSDPTHAPDVAVAATAIEAPALVRIHDLQQNPVAAHRSSREDFWARVLEPMATGATEATILDGYLFNRISELAHGRGRSTGVPEHVCWLLQHLDCVMAGRSTVRLIGNASKLKTGDDAQTLADTIRDRWMPDRIGRLATVEILLGDPGNGRRAFPHDRHIRFSTGSAIKIPAGFDRLSDENIWDTSGMWWDYLWHPRALDGLRADEQAATGLARHPRSIVISR